ncbi:MAG TPA: hypothetical protein VEP93_14460 [Variovorax sp.]|nr:hypothetical protein [Variovorax sp.]
MTQSILNRVFVGKLPMQFTRQTDIGQLRNLCSAGYLTVTFASFKLGQPASAIVTDITPLGRAVIRYFGFQRRTRPV